MPGREAHVQPPSLDTCSDLPLFNTKAVVQQTGVPAPTLRAWEQRYGILCPRRNPNAYRLYSERDILTVTWLRERIGAGMTISQAIALLKSLESARRRSRRSARGATLYDQWADHSQGSAAQSPAPAMPHRFAFDELQAALLHHFTCLDEPGASATIAQALVVHSVEDVCLRLLEPALRQIGQLWAAGALSSTVEHFAAALVRAQIEGLFRGAGGAESGPLVVVGCAPGEQHEIGALTLALFLRRSRMRTAYIGQNVEPEGLLATVIALRPAAVLLSATMATGAEALVEVSRRLAGLPEQQPLFGFGGQAFTNAPSLAPDIPGVALGADALGAVRDLRRRLLG
jgi:DNA-binding transcriptional MerR regulator